MICDDGVNAYWVTAILDSGVDKTAVYKKPLTGSSASTADVTLMFSSSTIVANEATMEYVKDRIIMAVNNKIFEFATTASSLPTAVYTHASTGIVFTSVAASGTAIYD